MQFSTIAHFSGISTQKFDLTTQLPWLYVIAALRERLIYIGETYDEFGLVVRLGRHFGRPIESSLRQAADKLGIIRLMPPFIVIATKLPFGEDNLGLDATAKKVRLLYESVLHQYVSQRFTAVSNWTIISNFTSNGIREPQEILEGCESIYNCFISAINFIEPLTSNAPFHLVVLDQEQVEIKEDTENIGLLIERAELTLFNWVLNLLKKTYPEKEDSWWFEGIPETIRKQCQNRREEEKGNVPPEAYLTLIDFRDIVKANWQECSGVIENISGEQGKEKATGWIVYLNEKRKLWAHPIKQKYAPLKPSDISEVKRICGKISEAIPLG